MHRIFLIEEIIRHIFLEISPWVEDDITNHFYEREQKKTLFNLAISCSSFTEASLDILWRDMLFPYPLLHLFPADTIELKDQVWAFRRDPVQDEWIRFNYYGRRVHHLSLNWAVDQKPRFGLQRFSDTFFSSLRNSLPTGQTSLLPRLKRLYCFPKIEGNIDNLPLFITQNLETFKIACLYSPIAISLACLILQDEGTQFPVLRSLHLDFRSDEIGRPQHLASCRRILQASPNLEFFASAKSVMEDLETAGVIMELPHLTHIDCGRGRMLRWHHTEPGQHTWELSLAGLHNALRLVERRNVVKVETHSDSLQNLAMYPEVIHLLAQKCPQLKHLEIEATEGLDDEEDSLIINDVAPITPLLAVYQNILIIDIECTGRTARSAFVLKDEGAYRTLCSSWPYIQIFSLCLGEADRAWEHISEYSPEISIQGILEPFAAYCRNLRELVIWIELEMDNERLTPADRFGSSLEELNISDSLIQIGEETVSGDNYEKRENLQRYLLEIVGGREEVLVA